MSIRQVVDGLARHPIDPLAVSALGLLVLMVTPAVAVLAALPAFWWTGDRRYALIALVVLALLATLMGINIEAAIGAYDWRLELMARAGFDLDRAEFSADFGRSLEYYTGFVFEVVTAGLGRRSPVAGGGRYDHLLKAVGAPQDVPAVGAAVHTDRLLAAITNGNGGTL